MDFIQSGKDAKSDPVPRHQGSLYIETWLIGLILLMTTLNAIRVLVWQVL